MNSPNYAALAAKKSLEKSTSNKLRNHHNPTKPINKPFPFEKILENGTNYGFCPTSKGLYKPSKEEVVSHLKLLKSFVVLKKTITTKVLNLDNRDKLWQCYLTISVRRFIMFMDSIIAYNQKHSPDEEVFRQKLLTILPPLDIIMVWHSFLLNTNSFVDHVSRYKLLNWLRFGFTLKQLSDNISNRDFKYNPSDLTKLNFDEFIHTYSGNLELLTYNCYEIFDPSIIDLNVYCPNCKQLLITVPLTNDEFNNGFSDSEFEYKLLNIECDSSTNCDCGFNHTINHDELRKRQLWKDVLDDWFPVRSVPLYAEKKLKQQDPKSSKVIEIIKKNKDLLIKFPLVQFIESVKEKIPSNSFVKLRNYTTINVIHATIDSNQFNVNDDLVASVFRQERFIAKMEELNWLFSPALEFTVLESIDRYDKFIEMFRYVNFPIVPTLDIDLVWHTHQLNQIPYYDYTLFKAGEILQHDDRIEENRINKGFEHTSSKFKSVFGKDYSICFCSYCTYQRNSQRSIFKKNKSVPTTPITTSEFNIGHISCHDSVHICTKTTNKIETRLKNFYLKTYNNYLPWKERYVKGYITSPVNPIEEYDNITSSLYENGMCVAVNDPQSGCSGKSGIGCFAHPNPYVDPNKYNNQSYCGGSSG